jgi:hypothetical protein
MNEFPPQRLLAAALRVPSSRDPDVRYIVVINPSGKLTCSCPAGWYRRPCRHVKAVTP